jgi:hypothetical protein
MYMKIVTGDAAVRHLCLVDQFPFESGTLCGCAVTRSHSWKRISSLEGDECPQCAELAFNQRRERTPEDLKRSG